MAKWWILLSLLLTGCSSDPTPVISKLAFSIQADATINATSNAAANPVVVRVYQLTDKQLFEQLPFIDLYNQDVQMLAANLISKQVLPIVLPSSQQTIELDINVSSQYLAVLVEFANYQQSTAKAVIQLPTDKKQYPQLTLSGIQATLSLATQDSSWWQIF